MLDVGVGGGAIALAIKAERRDAHVTGVDTSTDAVGLAHENAAALSLDVELRQAGFEAAADGWDLVVANPPYIPTGALASLQPELQWEPREALVGNGLHEEIARVADTRAIAFEVGDGHAHAVASSLAVRSDSPSGLKATLLTAALCPSMLRICFPVLASQMRTVLSALAVATS